MNASKQIINNFLIQVTKNLLPKNTLILNFTTLKVLYLNIDEALTIGTEADFSYLNGKNFELILGDLPIGMQSIPIDQVSNLKINKNWSYMLTALEKLQSDGKAFFIAEQNILSSVNGKRYLQYLEDRNYYLDAVFELPERTLYPEAAVQLIIVVFGKVKQPKLFIGEITSESELLSDNYLLKANSENIVTGLIVERSFESFGKFRAEREINNLKTQYNEYNKYKLGDVAIEINVTRDNFVGKPNSLYIPKIGNSQAVSTLAQLTVKHQNYFQVVLNEEIVKAEFLALFYRSDIGRLILKTVTSCSVISTISKSDIQSSLVAIPKLAEQALLILTNQKLSELQDTINLLKTELSLNPKNANVILDKFESMQGPLKSLTEEDQILSLIRKGENKHIEFKETFSKNIRTNQKDKEIEKSSLKNIVGYLNADGGTLLIGVSDDGQIAGVESDFFNSADNYKLNFKNALKTKIGSEFYSLIDFDLYSVDGKLVLKIDCKPSSDPCFYDQIEFYVRTNPATDKLEGKKQVDYIKTRFK